MQRIMITFLLLMFAVLAPTCFQPSAMAQIITSSISGTAIDSQKAVIVGAVVTLGSSSNPVVRQVKTNKEGFFNLVDIQPGTYFVSVEAKGFGTLTEPGIVVTASQNMSLGRMTLEIGSVNDTVTVASNTSGIDTSNPNTETGLSTEELDKIQVRSYDIMDALTLLAGNVDTASGTHDAPNSASGSNTYTDGMRNSSKNVMIDGVATTDPGNGATINTLPSIGMIQELKVTASNFRADSGRNAGPSVILVTKSGGQKIHGSFNIPVRNEFFDANDPDQKRQGLSKAPYRLVLPDVTVTGPLLIPHVVDARKHLFFTLSLQYQSQSQNPVPSTKFATVPTLLERQGNFSQSQTYSTTTLSYSQVCLNPTNPNVTGVTSIGTPAKSCGTQIGSGAFQSLGQQILNLFPLPNVAPQVSNGTYYNYVSNTVSTTHRQSQLYRVDWQPGSKISMYVRFLYSPETDQAAWNPGYSQAAGGFSNISWNDGYFQQKSRGTGFLYNITQTFSSTLVNTIGVSTSTSEGTGSALNNSAITAAGTGVHLPQLFAGANTGGYLPSIGFGCQNLPNNSACPSTLFQDAAIASIQLDASFPNHQHLHSFQVTDNLTKTIGTHSLVAGIYWEVVHRNFAANGANTSGTNDRGSYSFQTDASNPCDTADPWANVLTGCIDSYFANSTRPEAFLRFKNNEAYIQDEWRANPRLTLSYGLRFYHDPPAHDALNQYQVFVPSMYNRAMAPRLWVPVMCNPTATGAQGAACNATQIAASQNSSCAPIAPVGTTTTVYQQAVDPATGMTAATGCRGQYIANSSPLSNPETNGIVQAGTHGIPRSIFTNPWLNLAPRFGFNYSLTPSTIIKGGWGMYYDRYPLQNQLNMLSNPPINQQIALDDIQSFAQITQLGGSSAPPQLTTLPLGRFIPPTTKSYSLEVQHKLGENGLLGVAYVGNNSQHQVARQQINGSPLYTDMTSQHPENIDHSFSLTACNGAPCAVPFFFLSPYYGYQSIYEQAMTASANYNGLQVNAEKRYFHRHLQLRGNWTYSKAMGVASVDYASLITDPREPIKAYSPLNYDRRHIVNFFPIIDFPDPGQFLHSRFVSGVARGWSVSGTWRFSTGSPFTPSLYVTGVPGAGGNGEIGTAGNVLNGSWDNSRAVLANPHAKIVAGDKNQVFSGPNVGTWGNIGQNQFHFPSWQEFDATLYRTFHTTEHFSMIFRTEVYNIPNSTLVSSLNSVLQYGYGNGQTPVINTGTATVPGTGVLNANPAFFTAASGAGFNGNINTFFRKGRVIQFDLSGRF